MRERRVFTQCNLGCGLQGDGPEPRLTLHAEHSRHVASDMSRRPGGVRCDMQWDGLRWLPERFDPLKGVLSRDARRDTPQLQLTASPHPV